MTIHIFLCFPETAGKSLEEVEDMFLSDTKPWQTKVAYTTARKNEAGQGDVEKRLSFAHSDKNVPVQTDSEVKDVRTMEIKT